MSVMEEEPAVIRKLRKTTNDEKRSVMGLPSTRMRRLDGLKKIWAPPVGKNFEQRFLEEDQELKQHKPNPNWRCAKRRQQDRKNKTKQFKKHLSRR
jgi:hypothetical protein